VRVRFLNLVQVVRFTIPFNHDVSPELYTKHRNAIDAKKNTPLCNLYLSMLQRLGVETDAFGSSTGILTGLA
jgi:hypothetical protein